MLLLRMLFVLLRNILLLPLILFNVLRREPHWVSVRLKGAPPYRTPPHIYRMQLDTATIEALENIADRVSRSRSIRGVVLELGPLSGGWGLAHAIWRQIDRLRNADKEVFVLLRDAGNREFYAASGASVIATSEAAPVLLHGFAAEIVFLGDALHRAQLKADIERVGRYKGAVEPLTRGEPSEEFREATSSLVEAWQSDLVSKLADGRGWDIDRARNVVEGGPYTAAKARELGLVDTFAYPDELEELLAPHGYDVHDEHADHAGHEKARIMSGRSFVGTPRWSPIWPGPVVAIITLHGLIRSDTGASHPLQQGVTPDSLRFLLDKLSKDPLVKGVVLIIDSRGGSAAASDEMWRTIYKFREKKPLVAWLGDVAASGGYYIASAATKIVAAPGTLTGSIGVLGGKFVIGEFLGSLGIRQWVFSSSPKSAIFSSSKEFEEDEREWLRQELRSAYELFVRRVAQGRGMSESEIEAVAEGRVWTGTQAHERHLVDSLGAAVDAIEEVRSLARIPSRVKVRVVSFSTRRGFAFGGRGYDGRHDARHHSRSSSGFEFGVEVGQPLGMSWAGTGMGGWGSVRRLIHELLEVEAIICTDRVLAYFPPIRIRRYCRGSE